MYSNKQIDWFGYSFIFKEANHNESPGAQNASKIVQPFTFLSFE